MTNPTGKDRHCCYCGTSIGFIEDRFYDKRDTCGARQCERESCDDEATEYADAHQELDRIMGW